MPVYRLTVKASAVDGILEWTMFAPDYKQALMRAQADDRAWNASNNPTVEQIPAGPQEGVRFISGEELYEQAQAHQAWRP